LELKCGGFLKGHSSPISRIKMKKLQDFFYSMGLNDQTVIEWQVESNQELLEFPKISQQLEY